MMKKTAISVAVAAMITAASSVSWAAGYAGIDIAFSNIDPDNTTRDADVESLQFKYGSWLNDTSTLGAEFRLALGIGDDSIGLADVEIDRYYGVYLRGQFPDTVPVRPYGIAGFTRVETTIELNGDSDGKNYDGLSLGIGAEMNIQKNIFIALEFLRAVDNSGDEVSNLSLGIGGRF